VIRLATIKHIASKNANYGDAETYLTMQHDEFTMKPVLDKSGNYIPREEYLFDTLLCGEEDFAIACMKANLRYGKNNKKGDVKSHHYIISFDPRDGPENGLTLEKAQAIGMEFCKEHFPGHQAIVCTHPDGHNHSGNIHCHIVINSLRIEDVPFLPYMDRPCDTKAGMKHRCTAAALRYLRSDVMEMCHREGLHQIDLLNGRKDRVTEREYWAQRKGQRKLEEQETIMPAISVESQNRQSTDFVVASKPPTKFETDKEKLRRTIRAAMEKAQSFDEFTELLLRSGVTVKESRGRFSYLTSDRTKPITSRKLGDAYSKEAVMEVITENRARQDQRNMEDPKASEIRNTLDGTVMQNQFALDAVVEGTSGQSSDQKSVSRKTKLITLETEPRIERVIDIKAKKAEGKGPGYEQWAKKFNLKQSANALILYREYGLESREELDVAITSAHGDANSSRLMIKKLEAEIRDKKELQKQVQNYVLSKEDYAAYKKIKSKRKQDGFYESHRYTMTLHDAAMRYFDSHGMKKIPTVRMLQSQIEDLISEKNSFYESYHDAQAREQELRIVRDNIDAAIGRNQEQAHSRRGHRRDDLSL